MEIHPVLLFDFDGVIMKSVGPSKLMAEKLTDRKFKWRYFPHKPLYPKDLIRMFELSSRPSEIASLKAINRNFSPFLPSFFQRWRFFYEVGQEVANYERKFNYIFPDVKITIEKLKNMGITLGIISNSHKKRIEHWLYRYKMREFFSVIVGRDDRTKYLIKPDPRPILGALVQLKHKFGWGSLDRNHCAFVGDNIIDIQAAHNAGVKSFAILTGHGERKSLASYSPTLILENFAKILDHTDEILF